VKERVKLFSLDLVYFVFVFVLALVVGDGMGLMLNMGSYGESAE